MIILQVVSLGLSIIWLTLFGKEILVINKAFKQQELNNLYRSAELKGIERKRIEERINE